MNCENQFCVYWSESGYVLKEISLDLQGICQNCLYVNFPSTLLKQERQKALKRLENDE